MRRTIRKFKRNVTKSLSAAPVVVIVGAPLLTYYIVQAFIG